MKFSCERCGKKYATADTPQAGRVYKLKCKACGHVIVVKAPAAAPAASAAAIAPGPAPATPPPEISIEIEPPAAHRAGANGAPAGAVEGPLPRAVEPTLDVTSPFADPAPLLASSRFPEPVPFPEPSASGADDPFAPAAPPPRGEAPGLGADPAGVETGRLAAEDGYVDLFADQPSSPGAASDDPFLAAARGSLPDGFASGSADPFAPIRAELDAAASAEAGRAAPDRSAPLAAPKVPDIPKAPAQKKGFAVALVAAGLVVMLGILAFALLRLRGPGPEPRPAAPAVRAEPRPVAAEPAPSPAQPPPAPAEPAPAPAVAAPEPAPAPPARPAPARPERRQRAERARAEARPETPRPAPVAERPAPPPPPPPPRAERAVQLPAASDGLSSEQIQKVLASTRKAFDGCIAGAAKSPDVKLDGRTVSLRLNIQPNGSVTYPTLDDVTLNGTEMGSCLKSASRLMVFPKFEGDPMRIEVPLTLSPR